MAVFVLDKSEDNIFFNEKYYKENHIVKSTIFRLKEWTLHLAFHNIQEELKNVYTKNNIGGLLIGTVLYCGYDSNTVLKSITEDFLNNTLNLDNLKGNYVLIFWRGNDIFILNDKLGVQPIFYDKNSNRYSSSFLLLLKNSKSKFKINQDAFLEKLATGFISGSDTLVIGISKILPSSVYLHNKNISIKWIKHSYQQLDEIEFHSSGKKESIKTQMQVLGDYFNSINNSFSNEIGDLGLSSGFDCRLILGLGEKHLNDKLHLHSHNTNGVHDIEIKYATKLASLYNSNLNLIPTERLESLNNQSLEKILTENLNFFDGNSARHLGAFSQTYTYLYKKATMGNATYSLNGLGGEIYRDSYFTGNKKMTWNDWVNRYVFLPFSKEAVGSSETLKTTADYIRSKLESQLEVDYDKMDIFSTHAYYGLIKMPQCNGSVASAYGKVSPFLFPFIEYEIILEALKAIPYLGIGGQYQAQLIRNISPKLARVGSHYGFSFDKLSVKYLLWSKLKTLGSVNKRTHLVKTKLEKRLSSPTHLKFLQYFNNNLILNEAKEILLTFSPKTNFDKLLIESTQKRYIIYLAFSLRKLNKHIEI